MKSVNVPAQAGEPFLCVGETSRLPSDPPPPPPLVVRSITIVGRGHTGTHWDTLGHMGDRRQPHYKWNYTVKINYDGFTPHSATPGSVTQMEN